MHSIAPRAGWLSAAAAVTLVASGLLAARGASAPQPKPRQQVPLVVKVDDRGFRWSDAGIGAAAGFGAALVLAGSLALAGRPRHHKEEEP
jgi:hypothetical protein